MNVKTDFGSKFLPKQHRFSQNKSIHHFKPEKLTNLIEQKKNEKVLNSKFRESSYVDQLLAKYDQLQSSEPKTTDFSQTNYASKISSKLSDENFRRKNLIFNDCESPDPPKQQRPNSILNLKQIQDPDTYNQQSSFNLTQTLDLQKAKLNIQPVVYNPPQ